MSPGCDQMDEKSANLNTERGARLTLAALTERMTTKKDELETFLIANEGSRAASDFCEEGSGVALVDGQDSTRRRTKNLLKQTWREYKNSFEEYRESLTKNGATHEWKTEEEVMLKLYERCKVMEAQLNQGKRDSSVCSSGLSRASSSKSRRSLNAMVKVKATQKTNVLVDRMEELEAQKKILQIEVEQGKLQRAKRLEILRCEADCDSDVDESPSEPGETSSNIEDIKQWLEKLDLEHQYEREDPPPLEVIKEESSKRTTNLKYESVGFALPANEKIVGVPSAMQPQSSAAFRVSRNCKPERDLPCDTGHYVNQKPTATSPLDSSLGAAERHLIISNLKIPPSNPFAGEAHLFNKWYATLKHKMSPLQLDPLDELEILEIHTAKGSRPRAMIQSLTCVMSGNPHTVLSNVHKELIKRFGSQIEIASALLEKLYQFPKIKGFQSDLETIEKMRNLCDLCNVVSAHMESNSDLRILDSPFGVAPIRKKLPIFLDNAWRTHKAETGQSLFSDLTRFISKQTETLYQDLKGCEAVNKASCLESSHAHARRTLQTHLDDAQPEEDQEPISSCPLRRSTSHGGSEAVNKASRSESSHTHARGTLQTHIDTAQPEENQEPVLSCPLHQSASHSIQNCNTFKKADYAMRKLLAENYGLCLRCLGPHCTADCVAVVNCEKCGKDSHITVMHSFRPTYFRSQRDRGTGASRLNANEVQPQNTPTAMCTSICEDLKGRSCSKTVLVDVSCPQNGRSLRTYAIIDEQSDQSFATSELLDKLNAPAYEGRYTLRTLSGTSSVINGRICPGLTIQGVLGEKPIPLPELYENNFIPDTKHEVASKRMVELHPEIRGFSDRFADYDSHASVTLLIGRDGGELMATEVVRDQMPLIHKTALGFAVVGNICPTKGIRNKECFSVLRSSATCVQEHFEARKEIPTVLLSDIFQQQIDDDQPGLSKEDAKFLDIVSKRIRINESGHLEAPLPFRNPFQEFPDNRDAVHYRELKTLQRLRRDEGKLRSCTEAMQLSIDAGHVEPVPANEQHWRNNVWFVPIFPVSNVQKGKTRMVFDSAAKFSGVSLNSTLLSGPCQNNTLIGVLTRFRNDRVAFAADIESMFHSFHVPREHRDFQRFFWFEENDPSRKLSQFRAKVHIFGNTCSPAIANMCLRKAADVTVGQVVDEEGCPIGPLELQLAENYISNNFYVDDGLGTAASPPEAIKTLKTSRAILNRVNVRLHKIKSNDMEVMESFPPCDRAKATKELLLTDVNSQSTLGVSWNIPADTLRVRRTAQNQPFTRRGVLSVVNSTFDPLGIVAPIVLGGRLLMRKFLTIEISQAGAVELNWDQPLPHSLQEQWNSWIRTLETIQRIEVPRCFIPIGFGDVAKRVLHVFCDASSDAIGYVMYLKSVSYLQQAAVTFLRGNSRVSPRAANTIPRLELCSAVEASISARQIINEMNIKPDCVKFHTDSMVVLGYINNESKRFTRYVTRRVDMIRQLSSADDWNYVSSKTNPADLATRAQTTAELLDSSWMCGPPFLKFRDNEVERSGSQATSQLPEAIKESIVLSTQLAPPGCSAFRNVYKRGSWTYVKRIAAIVVGVSQSWRDKSLQRLGVSIAPRHGAPEPHTSALYLVRDAQREHMLEVLQHSHNKTNLPNNHKLVSFAPFVDEEGLVRAGGRLKNSGIDLEIKHPVILPRNHPISDAVLSHYHAITKHQGRHITVAALRNAGFLLEQESRQVRKFLNNCLICRKLRASLQNQQMSDLPQERTRECPPFTFVGCDVMGHWMVQDGANTRKNSALRKMWAVIFVCLASRAVHLELISTMDSSSFINAFKRFVSLRGPCKQLRSDRGTNFVGADNQGFLQNEESVRKQISEAGCEWIFHPPHASHFGGVWERKIGLIRRCLDSSLLQLGPRHLRRDELHTFLMEAVAIVNSTPLWSVSQDPNDPIPLTPSMLLTLKSNDEVPSAQFTEHDLHSRGPRQWRRTQYLAEQFWSRFRREYLLELQRRRKWLHKQENLKAGDLVLVKEKSSKRYSWPTAVIDEVIPSSDGLVRKVVIRTIQKTGDKLRTAVFERPITELVLLERS